MAAFPPIQPHTRQSSADPAPIYSYPPPPKGAPNSNGAYALPGPPSSPPTGGSYPSQSEYADGQYPPPPIDQKAVQEHNLDAFRQNSAIGNLSISSQTPSPAAKMDRIPGGAPAFGEFVGAHSTNQDDVGTFNGGSYRISHRDTNSLLTIQLAMGCPLTVRPGK